MNALEFRFAPSPETNDDEVRALVDGEDVLGPIDRGSLGVDPPGFFAQPALLADGELRIGRCECGCVGCCDTVVRTAFADDRVTWTFGPTVWTFRRTEYERAVAAAQAS